jgi:hypothetical protein
VFQQIGSYFPNNLHEPYGFYLKNHAVDMKEIEEQFYLNNKELNKILNHGRKCKKA